MWNLKCLCNPLSRHASMTPGSDQNWSRLLNKSKSSTDCRDQAQEGACQEQEAVRQEKMDGLQNEFICNPLPEKALGLQTRPSSTWSGVFSVSGLIRIVQTLIQDLVMEIMLTFWTACMTPIETLIVWRDFLRRLRFQPSQSLRTVQSVNCQPPPWSTKEPPFPQCESLIVRGLRKRQQENCWQDQDPSTSGTQGTSSWPRTSSSTINALPRTPSGSGNRTVGLLLLVKTSLKMLTHRVKKAQMFCEEHFDLRSFLQSWEVMNLSLSLPRP